MINPLNELSAVYAQHIAEETPEEKEQRVTQMVKAIRYRARKTGQPLSKAYNDYIGSVQASSSDRQAVKQKLGLVGGGATPDGGGVAMKQRPEMKEELAVEAKVDTGLTDKEKAKVRTARQGYAGAELRVGRNVSAHTGNVARRAAHRERDTLNKDAKDIRKGRTNAPQFQGKTGAERMAQVKREKKMKESFSNWRSDLIEVIDNSYDLKSSKPKTDIKSMERIKDKPVNNKIVINPPMKEAFEEIGGTIIEMMGVQEVHNPSTADYQKAKKLNSPESPVGGQRAPKSMDPRKKGKVDSLTGLPEEVETVDEKFSMAADPSKRESPRPTFKAQDSKTMKLRSKAIKAVGTQRRQDKETGVTEEVLSERPYQITGPHSYTSGDGNPKDDVRIKNTATNVGKPMKNRTRARNKAEKMNQEYGASVYRVKYVEEIDYTVDSAVEFFMKEGINEDGLEIFIEELGLEGFVEFIDELAEETLLSEARAAKRRTGGKSYAEVKAEIDAREKAKAEKKAAAKPAPKAAAATAKAKQPTKKPVRDAIARGVFRAVDAYKKGMERHNAATATAKKAASVAGKGAAEFGKGFASGVKGGVKFAKDVHKAVTEDKRFSNWRDDFKAQEYEFIDLIKPEPLVTEASFEIDPKKHREEVKAKKIRDRTKTGDEGSEIAKKKVKGPKLMGEEQVDEGSLRPGESYMQYAKRKQAEKTDNRMTVSVADKKANTPAYQKLKAGDKRYKAAGNLGEKVNLKTADMGDVIDDFYKSDAPQFKGKSKKKIRQMAIAAKLGAEDGGLDEESRQPKKVRGAKPTEGELNQQRIRKANERILKHGLTSKEKKETQARSKYYSSRD